MKKLMLIGCILFVMCFCIACKDKADSPITDTKINEKTTDDAYVERMAFVSDEISMTVNSEPFQSGDIKARGQLIDKVLESLVKDQYLEDYTLYTEGENPRGEFTYVGGGTGSVMLSEFAKDQN